MTHDLLKSYLTGVIPKEILVAESGVTRLE